MQMQDLAKPQYRSTFDCLSQIVAREGVRGLFKGYVPCIMRSLPAASSTFLTFEIVSKWLK